MFKPLITVVILLLISWLCEPAWAQGEAYVAVTGPAQRAQEEAKAETPPAKAGPADDTLGMISRIASGEKKLTVNEVLNPDFWRGILQEVALAAVGFVPR